MKITRVSSVPQVPSVIRKRQEIETLPVSKVLRESTTLYNSKGSLYTFTPKAIHITAS